MAVFLCSGLPKAPASRPLSALWPPSVVRILAETQEVLLLPSISFSTKVGGGGEKGGRSARTRVLCFDQRSGVVALSLTLFCHLPLALFLPPPARFCRPLIFTSLVGILRESEGGGNTSSLPKNARARGVQAMAVDPETTTLSEGGVRRVFTTSSIGFIWLPGGWVAVVVFFYRKEAIILL